MTPRFLQERFIDGLGKRVPELFALIETADVTGMMRAFHSLAGIGGTYGFPEVTVIAREGEERCAHVLEHAHVLDVAALKTAAAKLDRIYQDAAKRVH